MVKVARLVVAALVGLAVLRTVPAGAFQVEWQAEPARGGAARVEGYVRNDDLKSITNLQVRVDRLAQDGSVTGTYRTRVFGVLGGGDRGYFAVRVPEAPATYRVAVEAFDWYRCGE